MSAVRGASLLSPSLAQASNVLGGQQVAFTISRGNLTIERVQYNAAATSTLPAIPNACLSFAQSASDHGPEFAQLTCTLSPGVGARLDFQLQFCTGERPPRCFLTATLPNAAAVGYPPPRLFPNTLRFTDDPISKGMDNLVVKTQQPTAIAFNGFALTPTAQLIQIRFG